MKRRATARQLHFRVVEAPSPDTARRLPLGAFVERRVLAPTLVRFRDTLAVELEVL